MRSRVPVPPRRIYGVDFSGAVRAGRKIWVASGVLDGDGLRIEAYCRAAQLPGSDSSRERCLAALRAFIGRAGYAAFGLDFPFSLPRSLIRAGSQEDFVHSFAAWACYAGPDAFRHDCRTRDAGNELRRATDREYQTPFSPYNLWLYRQTFFGIRDLLAPLVRERAVCVLPMQAPLPDRPWLLEVCPASTLKREGLYRPYKGRKTGRCEARAGILAWLERARVAIAPDVRQAALDDPEGDALDSILAAWATARAMRRPVDLVPPPDDRDALLEGRVYA